MGKMNEITSKQKLRNRDPKSIINSNTILQKIHEFLFTIDTLFCKIYMKTANHRSLEEVVHFRIVESQDKYLIRISMM